MAKTTSTQKPDLEMAMMKKEFDSMKQAYECLKPLIEVVQKGRADFSKTVRSPQAENFWDIIRKMSKEHDQLETEIPHPLQDPPKQGEAQQSWSPGTKLRNERGQEKTKEKDEEIVKKMRKDNGGNADAGPHGGSAGSRDLDNKGQRSAADPKSSSQGPSGKTRGGENLEPSGSRPSKSREEDRVAAQSQGSEKKERSQDSFKPPSQASGSPQPTTDVNEGSVNQQDGGASKTKHDTDIEKLKKEIKELQGQNAKLAEEKHEYKNTVDQDQRIMTNLEQQILSLKQEVGKFEKGWNEAEIQLQEKNKILGDLLDTRNKQLQDLSTLENAVKKYQQEIEDRDRTIMSLGNDLQSLSKEHNDLKSRFSKLAGHKLTDQNPDIADLSDPNRAMKLSEKFGALYDDAWTDAFEHLIDEKQKLKLKPKDAIEFLLECLKECWVLCKKEAETWMNSLQNNFLHPVQDTEANSKMLGGKTAVRLGSKDLHVIRDACRKIAPTVGVMVKQCFIMKIKKTQKNPKLVEECMTYLEGCVDVCWLMVLAEPPLHIDFNIKQGDRFDSNRHAAYSASGETVEFLVWPPLYNAEEKGGMLSKGTVSTERKISKK